MSSLEKVTENKLHKYLGPLNANIGTCLFKLDMIDEATSYTRKAYDIVNQHESIHHKYVINLNLANDLIKQKKYNEAKEYLSIAKDYQSDIDEKSDFILDMTYSILDVYMGNIDASKDRMDLLVKKNFDTETHINNYDYILEWCIALDQTHKLHLAKEVIKHCLDCINNNDSLAKSQLMFYMANIYEVYDDLKNSVLLYKKSRAVQDRLYKKNLKFITENTLKTLDLSRQVKSVMEESLRDTLTETKNRKALKKDVDELLTNNSLHTFLMFDIDFFKGYNDNYGHLKGDDCIRSVINAISQVLPKKKEQIYRYGGYEFIIVLSEELDTKELVIKILQVVRDLQIEHMASSKHKIATISIGVSKINGTTNDLQGLIDHADMNLYTAKFKGRNCACFEGQVIR